MKRVGVIGLGKMGLPIATNLIDRGFDVIGYRRSGSPELAEAGGTVAASAAEVAAAADVLLSIVPDADAVENVIHGPQGTLKALRPGTIHIEMSTIEVPRKTRLRAMMQARHGDLLDCPISGSPGMVTPRLATTFASGDRESVDAVSGVLDAIWTQRGPVMAERRWSPAPGPVRTLHPILEQIEDHTLRIGLSAPVFAAAKEVFDQALADGWGDLDIACVHDQFAGPASLPR